MRSLKTDSPKISQPRSPERQKASPASGSKGIVPKAPKRPRDGFEQARLPGKIGRRGGSSFEPSAPSTSSKAPTLACIGASGTKPQPSELSQAVRDSLDLSAKDIASRLSGMTQGQFRREVSSVIKALNLDPQLRHVARRFLVDRVMYYASGSGGSGNKPFGAE